MSGTKKHSGGHRINSGRRPTCGLCHKSVTKSEFDLGDAFRLSDGNTYHVGCMKIEWTNIKTKIENERIEATQMQS